MRSVCVSRSQAASAPNGLRLPVVENGIDTNRYGDCEKTREDFLLWLGRVCPEKGTHIALEVAHRLGLRLVVAGRVHAFPSHQRYFDLEVAPFPDSKREFVGPVGLSEKVDLLARARCLLIPSLVAETSSLVAMEALASGTPDIAFRSGALPEIVEHGRTGFIVDGNLANDQTGRTSALEPQSRTLSARCHFRNPISLSRSQRTLTRSTSS